MQKWDKKKNIYIYIHINAHICYVSISQKNKSITEQTFEKNSKNCSLHTIMNAQLQKVVGRAKKKKKHWCLTYSCHTYAVKRNSKKRSALPHQALRKRQCKPIKGVTGQQKLHLHAKATLNWTTYGPIPSVDEEGTHSGGATSYRNDLSPYHVPLTRGRLALPSFLKL